MRDPDLPEYWAAWRQTGRVPDAPACTLRVICKLQANLAEAEATLPHGDRAHREKLKAFAVDLMDLRPCIADAIGREVPFPRETGGLTVWPWEDSFGS